MSATAQNKEELELVLRYLPIDQELKDEALEKSDVTFRFQEFLRDKYPNVRMEILDNMMNTYIQIELKKPESMTKIESDPDSIPKIIGEVAEQFAKSDGFDESLQDSFTTMFNVVSAVSQ